MSNKQAHVFINGRVQGVFFRDFVRQNANTLSVKGWVRNLPDKRVEAVFLGDDQNVKKLIDLCWHGSESSRVDDVAVSWEEPQCFDSFQIIS